MIYSTATELPLLPTDLDTSTLWPSQTVVQTIHKDSSDQNYLLQTEVTTPQNATFETSQLLTPPQTTSYTTPSSDSMSWNSSETPLGTEMSYITPSSSLTDASVSEYHSSIMTPETDPELTVSYKSNSPYIVSPVMDSSLHTHAQVRHPLPLPVPQIQLQMPSQFQHPQQPTAHQSYTPLQPQPVFYTISQQGLPHEAPKMVPNPYMTSQYSVMPNTPAATPIASGPRNMMTSPMDPMMNSMQPPPPQQHSLLVSPVNDTMVVPQSLPIHNMPPPIYHQQQYQMQWQQQQQQLHQLHQQQLHHQQKLKEQQTQQQQQQQSILAARRANAEELQQTKMVKLTRMTPERIETIKKLAEEKGIQPSVVESVLLLYTPAGRDKYFKGKPIEDDMSKLEGDDIYIKIVVNGGGVSLTEDELRLTDVTQQYQQQQQPMLYNQFLYAGSPGNPAAAAAAAAAAQACRSGRRNRKARVGHVKRPLNSFMLYRKSQTQSAMAYAVHSELKLNHQNISQIVGLMWQTESKEVKEQFAHFAGREKEIHRVLHPDYKFCPQKKKKRAF